MLTAITGSLAFIVAAQPHLSTEWYFTCNSAIRDFSTLPEQYKTFRMSAGDSINLDKVNGVKGRVNDECIVYNKFTLLTDSKLGFGAGADWWFEAYLNGQRIYSTFPDGNEAKGISPENHKFTGQGRQGENLLAVRVRRGSDSWKFCFAAKSLQTTDPCLPVVITADFSKTQGTVKPMNAVNNGPVKSTRGTGNMEQWKNLNIPFARNHDAGFYASYGGEHIVDVHAVFPDFSKDPEDPASYDFTLTDEYLATIQDGGSEIFYRLGSKIEHAKKKYGTKVPPDFRKWAVICEHIIRHYNEGWANGYRWNIRYWEIWNEPDLGNGQLPNPTWQGTEEEFFAFYRVAALHLKKRFPELKIGGPALAGNMDFMRRFLTSMVQQERVPLDFFSWHCYTTNPGIAADQALEVRSILDSFGYTDTESILNEWNYNRGWTGGTFIYSLKTINSLKGAVFTAAVMSACQSAPVDMLMYYDLRPCTFNGVFDFYTFAPLKGYYAFLAWSKLAALKHAVPVDTQKRPGLYATAATDKNGKFGLLLSRYFEKDELPDELFVTLKLNGIRLEETRLYLLDSENDFTEIPYQTDGDGSIHFPLKANTLVYLEN